MNSRDCINLLNLASDSNDQDIKFAYRKAVQQWHPDRHQQAPALVKKKAEKKMQDVNTAYSILSDYYKKHGYLPGYAPTEPLATNFTNVSSANTYPNSEEFGRDSIKDPENNIDSNKTDYRKPIVKKKSTKFIWISVMLIGIISFYSFDTIFSDSIDSSMNAGSQTAPNKLLNNSVVTQNTNPSPATTDIINKEEIEKIQSPFSVKKRKSAFAPSSTLGIYEEATNNKYFTYGDTGGRVFEIQGVPTRTIGDIWYYGKSEVHFQDGRVKSWVKLDNQLKVKR